MEATSFFEDGQQELESAQVEATGGSLRGAIDGRGDQCLDLNKQWPKAFHAGGDGDAAQGLLLLMNEDVRRIGYGYHSVGGHLVYAEFGGRTESVLGRTQDAVGVVTVTLEV